MADSSALDQLRQRLAAPAAPAWRPDQGDENPLLGTVEHVGERNHEQYGAYSVVTIVDEAGERRCWHAWGAVARQQLDSSRPRVGDAIAVSYEGERTSAEGRRYRCWRVEVERAAGHASDSEVDQLSAAPTLGAVRRPKFEPSPDDPGGPE